MTQETFVDPELLKKVPRWRNYYEAKLGFRNHWYPIRFSREVSESEVISVTLLGENILLKRIDGKVHAMRDRCIHRGVRLSQKVECYTKATITCWYHGFTYRWDSGEVCDVVASPDNRVIGRGRIKIYPVEEAKGLIFVFVGDDDYPTPPLSTDVPPTFLDDDMFQVGSAYPVNANWRLGSENGIDPLHIYIHRESPLIPNTQRSLPLGLRRNGGAPTSNTQAGIRFMEEDGGPKGILNGYFEEGEYSNVAPLYEGVVEGQVVVRGTKMHQTPEEAKLKRTSGSFVCLPCDLRIDNFPDQGLTQFTWCVPLTMDTHLYIINVGKRCATDEERASHEHMFWHRWKPISLEGFNGQDVDAREALQPFYGVDANWLEEALVLEDQPVIDWREFCHKHARGIQSPKDIA